MTGDASSTGADQRSTQVVVECGLALAQTWSVPLVVGAIVLVPPERELLPLQTEESARATTVLDNAVAVVGGRDVAYLDEVWVGYAWDVVITGVADELAASAIVLGWPLHGSFQAASQRPPSLASLGCPVIMVDLGPPLPPAVAWPPPWLVQAELRFFD